LLFINEELGGCLCMKIQAKIETSNRKLATCKNKTLCLLSVVGSLV
jgi:hypothetical protein